MSADGTVQIKRATSQDVQAHLLRTAKRTDKKPRDWLLFFFFHIVDDDQIKATKDRISTCPDGGGHQEALWLDFAHPNLLNAHRRGEESAEIDVFRSWLKMIACADSGPLLAKLAEMVAAAPSKESTTSGTVADAALFGWVTQSFKDGKLTPQEILDGVTLITRLAASQAAGRMPLLRACREAAGKIGALPALTLFEILRQAGMSAAPDGGDDRPAPLRSEQTAGVASPDERPLPVNLAFTFSGLRKLRLDALTLASFPDAFKEGMAARSARLHDVGPSDPTAWEGELGLPNIHGYFSGGGGFSQNELDESFWRAVRSDVAAFNDPDTEKGERLRYWMSLLFRGLGMEIAHVELGQDPYTIDDEARPVTPEHRLEHFGFRDGLSQPFVDLGLGPPPAGGASPSRNGTWEPVAPGEIFLDQPDGAEAEHQLPISAALRAGSTFLVFRKLEQDVAGFQTFLASRRPSGSAAQDALAAQMMGRWRDGTPLALSPNGPDNTLSEAQLNDFRYLVHDPKGVKCPLGAHVRRTNPRDIGGQNAASRHRILRRSISYGGSLLSPDQAADATTPHERRGLLFVAANARIDVQFEVIQSEWMNGGEFLGQAGLGRCPVLGAHDGQRSDSFLEAGGVAPVTGLPRFVITRGGDYFFAPGVPVVKALADGETFAPKPEELPYEGYALADCDTPGLFAPRRLRGVGFGKGQSPRLRVAIPNGKTPDTMLFVARHSDVMKVLRGDGQDFSVRQYKEAAVAIAGEDMLVSTDTTDPQRGPLASMLKDAWTALGGGMPPKKDLDALVRDPAAASLDKAITRIADDKRLDLVKDLAVPATYAMIRDVLGVPGPSKPSELAIALPFGRPRLTETPIEWVADAARNAKHLDPAVSTLQLWSVLILADLIGNLQVQATMRDLSTLAGLEMRAHIDGLLMLARNQALATLEANGRLDEPTTLLEAFVHNAVNDPVAYPPGSPAERDYYRRAVTLLLELVGTSMATIPLTFASVMTALFDFRIDLASLMPFLTGAPPNRALKPNEPNGVQRLIYEAERLNPNAQVRMRYCVVDGTLSSGAKVKAGEWVGCVIQAANLDEAAFEHPLRFSLNPYVDPASPVRDWENYLLFGAKGSHRNCWGSDKVAMIVLEECLKAAARLKRLRRPAGLGGRAEKRGGVITGLPARFTRVV